MWPKGRVNHVRGIPNHYYLAAGTKTLALSAIEILDCVAEVTQIDKSKILLMDRQPGARKRDYVTARQVMINTLVNYKQYTFERAGQYVFRDHATAIHAVRTIDDLVVADKNFSQYYYNIMKEIHLRDKYKRMKSHYFGKFIETTEGLITSDHPIFL